MATDKEILLKLKVKDEASKSVKKFGKEVDKSKKSTEELSGVIDQSTGGTVSKFKNLKGTVGSVVNSFKSLRVAVIASGIGALALGILAVVQAFKRNEEGQNKFAKLMGMIGAVTAQFLDLIADLGSAIIEVFENPKKAIDDFVNLLKNNIINRFEGLLELIPKLGEAISLLFKGEFSKAGKVALNATAKVALGVEDLTGKIESATKATTEFIKETQREADIAGQIADKRAKADKQERELLVDRAKANRKIAELREKAADKENVGVEERIKALIEAGAIAEDVTKKEIENARLRLEAKQQENALGLSTKEDKEEEARLEAKLINLETARLKLQKSLTAEITTARREAEAADKAKQAAIDAEAKKAADKERARQDAIEGVQKEYKEKSENDEAQTELEKLELEKTRALEKLDALSATEEQKLSIIQYYLDKENELKQIASDQDLAREQMIQEAKIELSKSTLNNISQALGENTKAGKAAAAAAALINTYQGITAELATKTVTPFEFGLKLANIATTAAIGFKNVKNILSTDPMKGGGSGGGAASAGGGGAGGGAGKSFNFNLAGSTGNNQLADAIGGQEKEPVRAYVVGNDISSRQELDNKIKTTATFG